MSYSLIEHPAAGNCITDPDALRAVCHSAAINPNDEHQDLANYWLGMWPKLLVLGTIKKQAEKQQLDPETNIEKLDWDSIQQEIGKRIPSNLFGILGANACRDWFRNRVAAYENHFPDYKRYNKSVIQQLFQHYGHHLDELCESGTVSNVYWERWFDQPSSGALSIDESPPPKRPKLSHSSDVMEPLPVDASPKVGILSIDENQSEKVSPALSDDMESVVETSPEVDESELNNNGNDPDNVLDNHEQANKIEGSIEQVPGKAFVVVESNAQTCSAKSITLAVKRSLPEGEHMTMTTVETFKRRKVDELEKNKARLLSVLWTINYGDGFLCEVSEEVKKLQGETWSCEYTLDKIEEKILNFKITNVDAMMCSLRCLLTTYLILKNERELTVKVSQVLNMLRKSTLNNLTPTDIDPS